jgi:hypothetical protein
VKRGGEKKKKAAYKGMTTKGVAAARQRAYDKR